jgi:histidyl-tRNA synthetase
MPAVGFAVGVDRTIEAMNENQLFESEQTGSGVLVSVFSPELESKSIEVWNVLQENQIPAEMWLDPSAKIEKQLRYADSKNKKYVVIIGQDELNADKITLKDMASGKSTLVTLDEAIKILSQ